MSLGDSTNLFVHNLSVSFQNHTFTLCSSSYDGLKIQKKSIWQQDHISVAATEQYGNDITIC